jgi:hypothetical protein
VVRITWKIAMKKTILFTTVLFIINAAIAQKTINDPNAVARNVSSFHGIEVSHGIDLYLTQGNEAVAVSATNEEYRDKIITKVENGILKIYYDHDMFTSLNGKKLKAYVSFKTLDHLSASGGADVYAEEGLNVNDLNVSISGGADFRGKINSANLKFEASGGSDVYISGKATSLAVEASGGSDFHGYDLITDNCSIEASGGSDVNITVNKELNVESSGGSDVHYKGNASIKNIHGGTSVKKVS